MAKKAKKTNKKKVMIDPSHLMPLHMLHYYADGGDIAEETEEGLGVNGATIGNLVGTAANVAGDTFDPTNAAGATGKGFLKGAGTGLAAASATGNPIAMAAGAVVGGTVGAINAKQQFMEDLKAHRKAYDANLEYTAGDPITYMGAYGGKLPKYNNGGNLIANPNYTEQNKVYQESLAASNPQFKTEADANMIAAFMANRDANQPNLAGLNINKLLYDPNSLDASGIPSQYMAYYDAPAAQIPAPMPTSGSPGITSGRTMGERQFLDPNTGQPLPDLGTFQGVEDKQLSQFSDVVAMRNAENRQNTQDIIAQNKELIKTMSPEQLEEMRGLKLTPMEYMDPNRIKADGGPILGTEAYPSMYLGASPLGLPNMKEQLSLDLGMNPNPNTDAGMAAIRNRPGAPETWMGDDVYKDYSESLKADMKATGAYADGGNLEMGGEATEYNGNRHEAGGIQIGNAEVEDGEIRIGDYVFSDRLLSESGKTFSDEAKKIVADFEEYKNDGPSMRTQDAKLKELSFQNDQARLLKQKEEAEQNLRMQQNFAAYGGMITKDSRGKYVVDKANKMALFDAAKENKMSYNKFIDEVYCYGGKMKKMADGGPLSTKPSAPTLTDTQSVTAPSADYPSMYVDMDPLNNFNDLDLSGVNARHLDMLGKGLTGFQRYGLNPNYIPFEEGEAYYPSNLESTGLPAYNGSRNISDENLKILQEKAQAEISNRRKALGGRVDGTPGLPFEELVKSGDYGMMTPTVDGIPYNFEDYAGLAGALQGLPNMPEVPMSRATAQGNTTAVPTATGSNAIYDVANLANANRDTSEEAHPNIMLDKAIDQMVNGNQYFNNNTNETTEEGKSRKFGNEEAALLASNLPAIQNLFRSLQKNETSLSRVNLDEVNLDNERRNVREAIAKAKKQHGRNVRGTASSAGEALAALSAGNVGLTKRQMDALESIGAKEEQMNVGISNQERMANTAAANQEADLRQRDEALKASLSNQAIADIGSNLQGYMKDKKMTAENEAYNKQLLSLLDTGEYEVIPDGKGGWTVQYKQKATEAESTANKETKR